jgi:hypothetical protein
VKVVRDLLYLALHRLCGRLTENAKKRLRSHAPIMLDVYLPLSCLCRTLLWMSDQCNLKNNKAIGHLLLMMS